MKFDAVVTIGLKEGILDPEGTNTKKALELLGFAGVSDVRTAKVFEVSFDAKDKKDAERIVDDMCRKLLINPVVNDYKVTFR